MDCLIDFLLIQALLACADARLGDFTSPFLLHQGRPARFESLAILVAKAPDPIEDVPNCAVTHGRFPLELCGRERRKPDKDIITQERGPKPPHTSPAPACRPEYNILVG